MGDVYSTLGPQPTLPNTTLYENTDQMYTAHCYSAVSFEGLLAMANSSNDPDRDSIVKDLTDYLSPGDQFNYLFDPTAINERKGDSLSCACQRLCICALISALGVCVNILVWI